MRNFNKFIFSLNFFYIFLIAAQVAAIIFLCLYIPSRLPAVAILAIFWLATTVTCGILYMRKGTPEVKCAWFVLISALPLAGPLIYLVSSVKKRQCGILSVNADNLSGENADDLSGLSAAANALCGTVAAGYDEAEYFSDGSQVLDKIFSEIELACERVYIEFFIIGRGLVFNRLIAALESARTNGAEVKIILDGVGSAFRIGKKEFKRLRALGAEIKIFHRLTPLPRPRINFRDHRKIVTVDGKTAFCGGFNLADEYANINPPYGYWKDTGIVLRGEAAKIFEGMFLSVWNGSHDMPAPASGKKNCLPFYDSPPHRKFCEDAYAQAINEAKTRVHILTPYFCPGEKTGAALSFAKRRGVDVKIIVPHIPDKKYAFEVTKTYAAELKKCGVKFYEYTPGFMHAKTLICDERVFLGSYNFDFRSMNHNFECGVLFGKDVCIDAERDFEECLALSAPLTDNELTPFKRFYRFVLKFFTPLV